ncbi:MAG: nicotinate phosphoribosyltransferase, partial [Bacillota bacterium]
MGWRLETVQDVKNWHVDGRARFHSATHEEIAAGATTDIYFIKTLQILRHLGLADKPVVAEIFPRQGGVLCGVEECCHLLKDAGVEVWALPEGSEFGPKEVVMRIIGPYGRFGV